MSHSSAKRNRVRIIGGQWRSRVIEFPAIPDLRPTPDRVRETLFNWLGQSLSGKRCLDLFAGSGVLGFEALSRAAERVVMVDASPKACAALRENAARLQAKNLELACRDALQFLAACGERFDVIFLDPPYRMGLAGPLLAELPRLLNPDGLVYLEADLPLDPGASWEVWRGGRAGQVHYWLLRLEQGAAHAQ